MPDLELSNSNSSNLPSLSYVVNSKDVNMDAYKPKSTVNSILSKVNELRHSPRTLPVNRRAFGDTLAIRKLIYQNIQDKLSNLEPIQNSRYKLSLHDVGYMDPDEFTKTEQKKAILSNKTLYRRLKGTWKLTDNATGELVAEKPTTLAQVPHLTTGGTFIINGTEYTLSHQMRLLPGIYTRLKSNQEVEAHANIMPGKGIAHRYFFEPNTGIFKINIGQAKIPLITILKAMGVKDSTIKEAWGDQLFAINQTQDSPHLLAKLYHKLIRKVDPEASNETMAQALANEFNKMELNPEVTKSTLGKPYTNMSAETILATSKKLLAVNKKEAEPDDRDHTAYQHLVGPEDILSERVTRDKKLLQKLLWQVTLKKSLDPLTSGVFTRPIMSAFISSGLGQAAEEVNAAELIDHQGKITRLGEGGIGDTKAIPDESRAVHPSQMGFIDPVKTPECHSENTQVMTFTGWKYWEDVRPHHKLACLIDGQLKFHKPINLFKKKYTGPLYYFEHELVNYEITPCHKLYLSLKAWDKAEWRFIKAEEAPQGMFRLLISGQQPSRGLVDVVHISESLEVDSLPISKLLGLILLNHDIHKSGDDITGIIVYIDSKKHKVKHKLIIDTLNELNMPFVEMTNGMGLIINSVELGSWLNSFKIDKHRLKLPEFFINLTEESREAFIACLSIDHITYGPVTVIPLGSSETLGTQLELISFSIGLSAKVDAGLVSDGRQMYDLHIRTTKHIFITDDKTRTRQKKSKQFYSRNYNGYVYCAEVPGSLLFTRVPGKLGFWSGNSTKTGVDLRTAFGAQKSSDGKMYAPMLSISSGKIVYRSPQELIHETITFPGELESGKPFIKAMTNGRMTYVPREQAKLVLPSMENTFSPLSNMVPMKSASKGQRVSMGARMLTQALPLMNAEVPHVQSKVPGSSNLSFEELYGKYMGSVFENKNKSGKVLDVTPDAITVKYDDGEKNVIDLYNHYPYNRKTYLHNTPLVKPGDKITPNQLLAKSNYTTDKGAAALGLNARVAYLPYKGLNYEDAVVISESMAKRLSSEHLYQHTAEFGDNILKGKNAFISIFPGKFDKNTLAKMDEHGVIKPGTVVNMGDPLILMAAEKDRTFNQLHRAGKTNFNDSSILWNHHSQGLVTDVMHTKGGVLVAVKAYSPMNVGDKLCYDIETALLTKDHGWVKANKVTSDMELASLNPDTGRIEYYRPVRILKYTHDGKMYSLQSEYFNLLVTDNHKLYAKLTDTNKFSLIEAKDCFSKRYELTRNHVLEAKLDEDLVIEDTSDNIQGYPFVDNTTLPGVGWPKLIGYILGSPGSVNDNGSVSYKLSLYYSPLKRNVRIRVVDFKELHHSGVYYEINKDRFRVDIFNKSIKDFAKKLLTSEKLRHEVARKMSYNQLIIMLRSVVIDRVWKLYRLNENKGDIYIPLPTKELAEFVVNAAFYNSVHIDLDKEHDNVIIVRKGSAIPKAMMINSSKQDDSLIDFNGEVYCVELPKNHILAVKRDNKICWSGNSGRYGDKGVVSSIIKDHEMPTDEEGNPFEILVSSKGLISRINPAQIIEGALGKIAAKTGIPYKVDDFTGKNHAQFAIDELEKHGLKDLETVTDPVNGRKIPNVFTGNRFFMKLHHTSESKSQGRGAGGGYSSDDTPSKGGEAGSKRLSLADSNALMSHGALDAIYDAHIVRGQRNPDYWLNFMAGKTPPTLNIPTVYHKFINELKAAGINIVREGDKQHIMALTNNDIDKLAEGRELQNIELVDWKGGLKPIKGGLFDPGLTGGHGGNKWAKITLHEPIPNPVMEEPIRKLLGLTEKKFLEIYSGKEELNGKRGPQAIVSALTNLNIDNEIARARSEIASGRKSFRDDAVKRLGYLLGAKRLGIMPKDWILKAVPVLPPAFRPISVMQGSGGQLISDPNYLYKELWDANSILKDLDGKVEDLSEERLNLYNSFKAVTGLGDPIQPKSKEKGVKGLIETIMGTSPKLGTVQFKLLGASVNLVGRGVITPDPEMDMDSIGIPEHHAWDVYKPFVIRNLVRLGMPGNIALKNVEEKTPMAKQQLLNIMDQRPVIVNRYPILHKYGIMAFWPKLVKDNTIHVSPIVTKPFCADFDGDTMQYHVPGTEEAAKDAVDKMLPSANLFAAGTFKARYVPNQEYVQGLHAATASKEPDKEPIVFATKKDAIRSYQKGEINLGTPIKVLKDE